ncbi:MAG: hypothetical protein ABI947_06865 [Chloroflexota bacterium]
MKKCRAISSPAACSTIANAGDDSTKEAWIDVVSLAFYKNEA